MDAKYQIPRRNMLLQHIGMMDATRNLIISYYKPSIVYMSDSNFDRLELDRVDIAKPHITLNRLKWYNSVCI